MRFLSKYKAHGDEQIDYVLTGLPQALEGLRSFSLAWHQRMAAVAGGLG
jgi:hypothetical protein